jgi:hypothetical protein
VRGWKGRRTEGRKEATNRKTEWRTEGEKGGRPKKEGNERTFFPSKLFVGWRAERSSAVERTSSSFANPVNDLLATVFKYNFSSRASFSACQSIQSKWIVQYKMLSQ